MDPMDYTCQILALFDLTLTCHTSTSETMVDWCRNLETAICFQGHNTLELKTGHLNCVPRADPRVRRGGKYET